MNIKFFGTVFSITAMMMLTSCATTKVVEETTQPAYDGPKVKVGLFLDKGCFGNGTLLWTRLLANSPQLELTLLDGQDVRYGKLSDLQLLVCPGGGGSKTAAGGHVHLGGQLQRERFAAAEAADDRVVTSCADTKIATAVIDKLFHAFKTDRPHGIDLPGTAAARTY